VREEILKRLEQIEHEENVSIVYACESGSRAWGFESTDSDWDVRFIYVRPLDWYLSIDVEEKRDVIERPINDELDISGWDLRKALQLLRKSNPPLLEWLSSPIIYKETENSLPVLGGVAAASAAGVVESGESVAQQLRRAIAEFYSPISTFHHYFHMAEKNNREFLKGELVRVKKYFYVLRPLLAIRWIESDPTRPVPMEFQKLVDACVDSAEVRAAIDQLLTRKRSGSELDREPKIEVLSNFIDDELTRLEKLIVPEREKPNFEKLNEIFRNAILGR
jgi:predicted nucleotidyltransferase